MTLPQLSAVAVNCGVNPPTAGSVATECPTILSKTTCAELFSWFQNNGGYPAIPVVDSDGKVLALVNRLVFLVAYAKPYYPELYGKKTVLVLANANPFIVDEHTAISDLGATVLLDHRDALTDCFVVTSRDRYLGLGTAESLMRCKMQLLESREAALVIARDDANAANEHLRNEIQERQAIAHELLTANTALVETQGAIRNLLDNADQGFLTVAPDLLVGDQSSAACDAILGEAPQGKSIIDLLCKRAPADTKSAMRVTLESVFRDSDDFIRDLKLGLLPKTFDFAGNSIKASYKFLANSGRLMIILTDVTEAILLSEAVEREQRRLEMTVLALTEGEAFAALVNDYRRFLAEELPLLLKLLQAPGIHDDLYRRVHTHKGLLAQFSFHWSPRRLHELESTLSAEHLWDTASQFEAFQPAALLAELNRDLENIADIMGSDPTSSGRRIALPQCQLQITKDAAREILISNEARTLSPSMRRLLQSILALGNLDVKSALTLHSRGATTLAARLGKQLAPIKIQGDDACLSPELYNQFFRSLVHVFRNAVDHGIETPEERALAGKAAEGSVCCTVNDCGDQVEITIEDDGHGINRAVLEAKLVAAGLDGLRVKSFSLEDLVFCEGLSSRDAVNEVSGRGIGMAAVRTELERVGGSVIVETERGTGTRFRFQLPTKSDVPAHNATILEMAIR